VGTKLFIFLFCLSLGFSAHAAKKETLVSRIADMFGCRGLLTTAQPLDPVVADFVKAHPDTIKITEDKSEPGTFHIRSRIYRPKDFPVRENLSPDAADELNFVVDAEEVRVPLTEASMINRGYHIIRHLPDHFPFAKLQRGEAVFALPFFLEFITELQNLGFAIY